LGSTLVEHAEGEARGAGRRAVAIDVVKEAGLVPFYEKRGYRVAGEHDGQSWNGDADWGAVIPWHMVDMRKELP
jgi:predicted N-acetyltransferase YhbS